MVADYIEHEGFEVMDRVDLEIPDNLEVGRRDPLALVEIYKRLKLDGVDALVRVLVRADAVAGGGAAGREGSAAFPWSRHRSARPTRC